MQYGGLGWELGDAGLLAALSCEQFGVSGVGAAVGAGEEESRMAARPVLGSLEQAEHDARAFNPLTPLGLYIVLRVHGAIKFDWHKPPRI